MYISIEPTKPLTIIEYLAGPHEWGYRDIAGYGFVEDSTPYEAANLLDKAKQLLIEMNKDNWYATRDELYKLITKEKSNG